MKKILLTAVFMLTFPINASSIDFISNKIFPSIAAIASGICIKQQFDSYKLRIVLLKKIAIHYETQAILYDRLGDQEKADLCQDEYERVVKLIEIYEEKYNSSIFKS